MEAKDGEMLTCSKVWDHVKHSVQSLGLSITATVIETDSDCSKEEPKGNTWTGDRILEKNSWGITSVS